MSETKIEFSVETERSFRAARTLPNGEGVDGYARAMAALTEAAAQVAANEGRMITEMNFAVERAGGDTLRLVASGMARLVGVATSAYRAIGGTP